MLDFFKLLPSSFLRKCRQTLATKANFKWMMTFNKSKEQALNGKSKKHFNCISTELYK
jgi:hypothetical protein